MPTGEPVTVSRGVTVETAGDLKLSFLRNVNLKLPDISCPAPPRMLGPNSHAHSPNIPAHPSCPCSSRLYVHCSAFSLLLSSSPRAILGPPVQLVLKSLRIHSSLTNGQWAISSFRGDIPESLRTLSPIPPSDLLDLRSTVLDHPTLRRAPLDFLILSNCYCIVSVEHVRLN
ncbi:hypothetical protein RRG08_041180 [Elysia crispata]|uniref:Uncharacterized protein n=1 Tax=Elysia crispata TaxID=231223 RepID=A0AAE0XYC7_9GAST|nr:hypothetical protein RRG08_041180 [Elysia crispata]